MRHAYVSSLRVKLQFIKKTVYKGTRFGLPIDELYQVSLNFVYLLQECIL